MNSAAVHTGLDSVPTVARPQQLRLVAELVLDRIMMRPAPMAVDCDVSQPLWDFVAKSEIPEIYPWVVGMEDAAPSEKYTTLFSYLPQVRGVEELLADFRNALSAALNIGYTGMLRASLRLWGPPPGKLVATHPHVTRGPSPTDRFFGHLRDL